MKASYIRSGREELRAIMKDCVGERQWECTRRDGKATKAGSSMVGHEGEDEDEDKPRPYDADVSDWQARPW